MDLTWLLVLAGWLVAVVGGSIVMLVPILTATSEANDVSLRAAYVLHWVTTLLGIALFAVGYYVMETIAR